MTAPKRRSKRGGGSVYYAKKAGRWEAVLTVTSPDTGKSRRRKMTAPDEETATRHLKQMTAERDETGGQVSRKDYTVAHALDDLLRHPPPGWKSATTRRINAHLAGRLRRGLGSVLLSRLTAGQVAEHLRREVIAGLAQRTIRDEKALLKRAIRRAQAHDLVSRNVTDLADMPAGAHTRKSGSMTEEQVGQMLTSGLAPWWRAWLTTALMLGLRPGELGALAWSDIGDDGVLRVRHSLHETPGGLVPGPTKTESSRRSLRLPAAVTEALAAWGAEQTAQQLLAGPAWQDTGGLLFTDGFGHPVDRHRLHHGFRRVCKAAGVARPDGSPFQIRELRHTFVSVLSARGVPIEVIADAAGHANSSVTRQVYRHQLADKVSAAAEVWDRIGEHEATP